MAHEHFIIDPGVPLLAEVARYLCAFGYVLSDTSGNALVSESSPHEFGLLSVLSQKEFGNRRVFLGVFRIADGSYPALERHLAVDVYGRDYHYLMTELSEDLSIRFQMPVTCRLHTREMRLELLDTEHVTE